MTENEERNLLLFLRKELRNYLKQEKGSRVEENRMYYAGAKNAYTKMIWYIRQGAIPGVISGESGYGMDKRKKKC